jgi:hypothetical protein
MMWLRLLSSCMCHSDLHTANLKERSAVIQVRRTCTVHTNILARCMPCLLLI